jgi:hypothetical protein
LGDDDVVPHPASTSIKGKHAPRSARSGPAMAWGHAETEQLAQPFGAVAGLVVDDVRCGCLPFVFLVLAGAAGFEVALSIDAPAVLSAFDCKPWRVGRSS